jgi:hypothetical protein
MIIYLKTAKMLSATLAVKPVGKSDARNRLVQSDERRWETERWPRARPCAPFDAPATRTRRSVSAGCARLMRA